MIPSSPESLPRHESRLLAPDLLRGIGVLLLLLTNIPLILTPVRYIQAAGELSLSGVLPDDIAILLFISVPPMAGMGMFVLAMGQGLSYADENSARYKIAVKRLILIGIIGGAHGLLIWWGDILVYYFLAGLIALFFRRRPPIAQIATGASIMMLPLLLTVSDLLARFNGQELHSRATLSQVSDGYLLLNESAKAAYRSQNFPLIQGQRLTDWLVYLQDFALVGVPQIMGLLLVGIGIARIRMTALHRLKSQRFGRFLRLGLGIAGIGYGYQLAAQLLAPHDTGFIGAVSPSLQIFSPPILAIGTYVLILRNEAQLSSYPAVRVLAIAGRYSLSIYILTSILCTFMAYGLGYYDSFSPSVVLAIALVLCIAQVAVFGLLQHRRKQGPLEILVRVFSRQPTNTAALGASQGES